MQTRFLLGPSGSGKTFRCLAEARAALRSPTGPPLLFLAPRQATFQIERQLLGGPSLAGYTRLRVLSFDQLAEFILRHLQKEKPRVLTDEGRLMVLRAIVSQKRGQLQLFHASARLRGFAQQLSLVLRELQRAQLGPEKLLLLAEKTGQSHQLSAKLKELALLLKSYLGWLEAHKLQDRDQLLALATNVLASWRRQHLASDEEAALGPLFAAAAGRARRSADAAGELWLDGFAELAPQEVGLLMALLPLCSRATLAFNLAREGVGPLSWLSSWSVVGQTYRQLRQKLQTEAGVEISVDWLGREGPSRFADNRVLQHLERRWADPQPYPVVETSEAFAERVDSGTGQAAGRSSQPVVSDSQAGSQDPGALAKVLRVVACPNPEAEATVAAREILRFVRGGGRYREAAVLVRNLEGYYDSVARTFSSFEIPFFLDRREPMSHHPLVELTRSALRTVSFGWQSDDLFAALKTGLVHDDASRIDLLENEALARGWGGEAWLKPLAAGEDPELGTWLEPLREKLVAPFQRLAAELGSHPTGAVLAWALGTFWEAFGVEEKLSRWAAEALARGEPDVAALTHTTLWRQMQEWLENISLAFEKERMSLEEWLPIVDTGLASQTVGVIPPTVDQVLVGAIDRSRNPDLKLALVLGVNESVFPAAPEEPNLLTNSDRQCLQAFGVQLSGGARHQLARERYYGYVACTRARERLVLTYALRDVDEKALNPSVFVDHLCRLFPGLTLEIEPLSRSWLESEHASELRDAVLGLAASPNDPPVPEELRDLPGLRELTARVDAFRQASEEQQFSPGMAEDLYGRTLETSVSRLEEYAACPFRFAMTSGLRVEERKRFQLDWRQQGSFQHEILAEFHRELRAKQKRWREITPDEARERIAIIGARLTPEYEEGLFQASEHARFTARALIAALQDYVVTAIEWMAQYEFDPVVVELAFGIEEKPLPAWEIDLEEGHRLSFRGKIDRVDLWRPPGAEQALCVVIDYKSSARRLEPVLMAHGVQLQLLAYLNVLRDLEAQERVFGVKRLIPAGVFYVNLRGCYSLARSRREVLNGYKAARARAYQHSGRFDLGALPHLDNRKGVTFGDQFNYRLRADGQIQGKCREPMPSAEFIKLLNGVERHLRRMGQEIYSGNARVDPYRKGNMQACDYCQYQSICRIDPWTQPFRVLDSVPA